MNNTPLDSLLSLSRPRFNFREHRKRNPVVGSVSPMRTKTFLFQILDSDASSPIFASWFLNRYQKILPKRITRLTRKEQKELTRHIKRMRHLLLFSTQDKPNSVTKPKRKRRNFTLSRKRRRNYISTLSTFSK